MDMQTHLKTIQARIKYYRKNERMQVHLIYTYLIFLLSNKGGTINWSDTILQEISIEQKCVLRFRSRQLYGHNFFGRHNL